MFRRSVFEAFLVSMLSFLLPLSQYYFIGLSPMICDGDGVEYVVWSLFLNYCRCVGLLVVLSVNCVLLFGFFVYLAGI